MMTTVKPSLPYKERQKEQYYDCIFLSSFGERLDTFSIPIKQTLLERRVEKSMLINLSDTEKDGNRCEGPSKDTLHRFSEAKDYVSIRSLFHILVFLGLGFQKFSKSYIIIISFLGTSPALVEIFFMSFPQLIKNKSPCRL